MLMRCFHSDYWTLMHPRAEPQSWQGRSWHKASCAQDTLSSLELQSTWLFAILLLYMLFTEFDCTVKSNVSGHCTPYFPLSADGNFLSVWCTKWLAEEHAIRAGRLEELRMSCHMSFWTREKWHKSAQLKGNFHIKNSGKETWQQQMDWRSEGTPVSHHRHILFSMEIQLKRRRGWRNRVFWEQSRWLRQWEGSATQSAVGQFVG